MMIVKCPKCGNTMKYQPAKTLSRNSKKTCVYCGRSFTVVDRMLGKHL